MNAEIGPWSLGFRITRHWFTGLEAARVWHSPEEGKPPWVWCIWDRGAGSDATDEGRSDSKGVAQTTADTALKDKGIKLA